MLTFSRDSDEQPCRSKTADVSGLFVMRRAALESERVSYAVHAWIDVTLGCAISGEAAVTAKNVALPHGDPDCVSTHGRTQLFLAPHPRRQRVPAYVAQKFQIPAARPAAALAEVPPLQTDVGDNSAVLDSAERQAEGERGAAAEVGALGAEPQNVSAGGNTGDRTASALATVNELADFEGGYHSWGGISADDPGGHIAAGAVLRIKSGSQASTTSDSGKAEDVAALGRLIVQLFHKKPFYAQESDVRWVCSLYSCPVWASTMCGIPECCGSSDSGSGRQRHFQHQHSFWPWTVFGAE